MIATGQKFSSAPSAFMTMTLRLRSQTKNLNVKVFVKVFKTSLNPNLITDLIHLLYDDTYWSKFLCSTNPHHPRSCQGQGHRLRILMLKFYAKFV